MKNAVINIVLFPFWILSIFSKNKSFGRNPIIKNPLLNFLGLHVFRLVLAHGISNFRFLLLSYLMDKEERKKFHEDGYLVLKNFLPEEKFLALEEEAINYKGQVTEIIQGDTATDRVWLSSQKCKELTSCQQLLIHPSYKKRLRYCAATNSPPLIFIQAIRHNCILGGADPQKTLHSDTFHPTMKAWLYLVDVTSENGPFKYIKGSNKLTWKRIIWEYRKSVSTALGGGGGSFRVTDEDLIQLGYGPPEAVQVPRNTLVIVNTFGLHCRGSADGSKTRIEIWAHSRVNPFVPFPGMSTEFIDKIRNYIISQIMQKEAATGKVSIVQANWKVGFDQESRKN